VDEVSFPSLLQLDKLHTSVGWFSFFFWWESWVPVKEQN
jgi:hypothetical protein